MQKSSNEAHACLKTRWIDVPTLSPTSNKILRWGIFFFAALGLATCGLSSTSYAPPVFDKNLLTLKNIGIRIGDMLGISSLGIAGILGLLWGVLKCRGTSQKRLPQASYKIAPTNKKFNDQKGELFSQSSQTSWEGWVHVLLESYNEVKFTFTGFYPKITEIPPLKEEKRQKASTTCWIPCKITKESEENYNFSFEDNRDDKEPALLSGYGIGSLYQQNVIDKSKALVLTELGVAIDIHNSQVM